MTKKILIIDDEAHIRALLARALEELEDAGVELLTAADGEQGLALARQEKPDLVLLDVMMPKLNGYDVCEAIKQDPELKTIHVIILTAKGQAIDKARAEKVQANEYITKPFNPDQMLQRAGEILDVSV